MNDDTNSSTAPAATDQYTEKGRGVVVLNISDKSTPAHDGDTSADEELQAGVLGVEAIATVWSKTTLIVVYVLIWIVYFIMLMQQGSGNALNPFVASAFQQHSLTPTVLVLSSIFGGVCNLTVAKILDVFGRPHGYAMALFITTIGIIMMAATNSVEMYAAAQVFWTVGNNALLYSVGIFVADTTELQNRGLMTAITASPNIITIWLSGPISQAFLTGPGWRWCFGLFSIIVPVLCLPLFGVLMLNYVKAKRQGLIKPKAKTRTPWQSLLYYLREFDAVGLILLTAGLALFLLPFNIYALQPLGWQSPLIICLLVFGVVLMIVFALWERFFAPITFMPYSLLLDRDMVGACVLGAVLFFSYTSWSSLFTSYLQVVHNLSVTNASYVYQIYGIGSSIFTIVTGFAIRYTGRYKAITLYGGIPLYTLFMGLMIYFREPDMNIGYLVMCQIFISFAAGVIIITPPIAAMSAADHQRIAVVVAVLSMFSSIGGAIGSTVASAIWQAIFPVKLAEFLPPEEQANLLTIYASLEAQLSYPVGSPARIAIQRAYAEGQSKMLAAGTAVWAIGFVAVAFWRNTDVKNLKQLKGQVI